MVIENITNSKKRSISIHFKTLCSKKPDDFRKAINKRLKKINDIDVKVEYIRKLHGFITGCPSVKTITKVSNHFNHDELRDLITYVSKMRLIIEQESCC